MRVFARMTYGFILQLHPHEFRVEFGDEMLWIFDEQMRCGKNGVARVALFVQLLLDVFRSAFIQRVLREQHLETTGLRFDQIGSSACVIRIAQGAFIVFSCLFSVFNIFLCLHMVMSGL
jgi:hypothetical protein